MADDTTAQTDTGLTRLRVLGIEETPRAKLLRHHWLYYACSQNDGMSVDFDGYEHTPGFGYLQERMRGLGYVPAVQSSIPFGKKRPTCHTVTVGHIVDTYTALLLGEGRQPAVRVVGDESSTELLNALMKHCGAWSSLAEARKISGATGAVAVLPEIKEGELSIRTLRPEHLYSDWTDKANWVPRMVIEQKKVLIEDLDDRTGKIVTYQVWRTRAWDETFAYAYVDKIIDTDSGDRPDTEAPDDRIELSEPPSPHGAGRCPVVWIQNTKDSDNPIGEPDCKAVFEIVDQMDKSQSMLVRGSRANTDPTLVRKDTPMLLQKWGSTSKGYGALIKVSPQGDAKLLEITGASITTAWDTVDRLSSQVSKRTGVIQPDPENSGAYQSGVALQILWSTQHCRAAERRTPLGVGIKQLLRVVLTQLQTFGLKAIGSEGAGVETPPRESRADADDGLGEMEILEHEIGDGGAIALDWPGFHEATPTDLNTTAQALSTATGGLPSMSQETAVSHMTKLAQTDTDVAEELERIKGERETKVAEFDESMRPDVEGLAEAELDENGDPIEVELGEDGKPKTGTTDQVQHEAMNGIQVKTLGDVFARTGADLTPIASKFTITEGFPNTKDREAELDAALASQVFESEKNAAKGEAVAGGEEFDSLGRPITRGKPKPAADVPEPRAAEDTGEQDEAE